MDCIRLDLAPLLGEIIPVTFKSKDKKVVQPVLTEDGWLSLAARACPERWAGPPITEPVTDKEFERRTVLRASPMAGSSERNGRRPNQPARRLATSPATRPG